MRLFEFRVIEYIDDCLGIFPFLFLVLRGNHGLLDIL